MKKLLTILLVVIFTFVCASCGVSEKKAGVYRYSDKNISVKLSVFAKDDDVSRLEQISELDIKGYSVKKVKEIEVRIKEMEKICKGIDGVEYSTQKEKNKIIENIVIPVNEETMEKIKKERLVPITDQKAKTISLKKFVKSLEDSGWKKEK